MLTSFVAATPSRSKNFHRFAVFAVVISLFVAGAPYAAQATTFTIFGPFPSITTTYGVGSIPIIPPTTNSPAPWVITSSNPKVATISGKTVNVIGAGYATITASQAAIGSYTARSRMTFIRVNQGTPTIGAFAPQSIPITQKTYTIVPPTSNSDGAWNFVSSNPSVASIVGTTLTTRAGGSTQIYATQAGTPNWKSAGVSMTFTVVTIAPVLGAFGDISIMKDSVSSLTLNPPTSTSAGAWTYVSSNPAVASIDRNIVTPRSFGKTIITATQNAVGDYGSATASMTLTVQGPTPIVGLFPDVTANLSTSSSVALSAPTSTSSGAWTFTSSDTSTSTINGLVITLLRAGAVTITAMQAATSTYASPTPLTMTLRIVGNPTVGPWSSLQKVVNDPDFTLAPPTSNSDGAWAFTSSDPSVIEIDNGVAKVKGAGVANIVATQAATSVWTQATASMSIQVFGHIPTLGTFAPITATVGDSPKLITPPTSNSLGTWTYVSSNAKVAKVDGSSLVIIGSGSATISATQKSAGAYSQSNVVQTTLTVKPRPTPTPTPTAKPTPTPTAKPTPTPTAKPTPTPTAKPTPTKPTPTKAPVNTTLKVTASGRSLTVIAIGVKPLVFINGKPGKVGKNTVKPGTASIVITIKDKVVYRRVFRIK